MPKAGHITIFDRTWYGRVLVERVEGFASEAEWRRAYDEINDFERQLADFGTVLVKFWLQIDAEEQLRRFQEREATPYKRWKITDEDWRNREETGAATSRPWPRCSSGPARPPPPGRSSRPTASSTRGSRPCGPWPRPSKRP